jgi:uncharacterized protein YeaO (DUF488 family)
MSIVVKRVYDRPSTKDGYRVLVDRLWPRGVTKAMARLDLWMRDIAPSTSLRTWYDHKAERWPEFQERYATELEDQGPLLDLLLDIERQHGRLTLVFAARDRDRNEARVLAAALDQRPAHSHQ